MREDFIFKFILSLFNEQTRVTAKQLSLIAGGKRTPSVLFNVEKNKLYTLFGLFPDLSLKEWESLTNTLLENELVDLNEGSLCQTAKGAKVKKNFTDAFPVNNELDQLRYSATKPLFWHRLIFTTQVFSEYSNNNKHYLPYLSSLDDQQSLKKWLGEQGRSMDALAADWFKELRAFFQTLLPKEADFIAGHLTGYNVSGSTSRQMQETFGLSQKHYAVFIDQLSYKSARLDGDRYPLLKSLWETTHMDCDEGLSYSARISKHLLEEGKGIEEIARRRKLKANTIKEHILECVLITDWPYFKRYIRAQHFTACHELLETNPSVKYAEAKTLIDDLDFFTFRLVEIERMRRYG